MLSIIIDQIKIVDFDQVNTDFEITFSNFIFLGWYRDIIVGGTIFENFYIKCPTFQMNSCQLRILIKNYGSQIEIYIQSLELDKRIIFEGSIAYNPKVSNGSGNVWKPSEQTQADIIVVVINFRIDGFCYFLVDPLKDFSFENKGKGNQ